MIFGSMLSYWLRPKISMGFDIVIGGMANFINIFLFYGGVVSMAKNYKLGLVFTFFSTALTLAYLAPIIDAIYVCSMMQIIIREIT